MYRLRRYDHYTPDQVNTIDILLPFLRNVFEGGAKFKFAPGRQLLSLRHWVSHDNDNEYDLLNINFIQ